MRRSRRIPGLRCPGQTRSSSQADLCREREAKGPARQRATNAPGAATRRPGRPATRTAGAQARNSLVALAGMRCAVKAPARASPRTTHRATNRRNEVTPWPGDPDSAILAVRVRRRRNENACRAQHMWWMAAQACAADRHKKDTDPWPRAQSNCPRRLPHAYRTRTAVRLAHRETRAPISGANR